MSSPNKNRHLYFREYQNSNDFKARILSHLEWRESNVDIRCNSWRQTRRFHVIVDVEFPKLKRFFEILMRPKNKMSMLFIFSFYMTKRLPGCHALSTADTLPNCQWPKEGLLLARLGFCRVRLLWACSFSRLKCATIKLGCL